jgi:uncharacterized protein YutE (UPF0331/DUF86 family)
MNETLIHKIESAQRCLMRAREIHTKFQADFSESYDAQDAAVLNLVRLCEISIDIANFLIRRDKLGIPTSSADTFVLLGRAGVISMHTVARMRDMVGFRNIAVHQYEKLDINIVIRVIEHDSDDIVAFLEKIIDRES